MTSRKDALKLVDEVLKPFSLMEGCLCLQYQSRWGTRGYDTVVSRNSHRHKQARVTDSNLLAELE